MKTNIGYKIKRKYGFKRERAIWLSFKNLWEKIVDSGKAVGGSVVSM